METYSSTFLPNQSDDLERYAFDQQPEIGMWNCLALAEALVTLLPTNRVPTRLLRQYRDSYKKTYLGLMREKLGLKEECDGDEDLIKSLLSLLEQNQVDYTVFFRRFSHYPSLYDVTTLLGLFSDKESFKQWIQRYKARVEKEQTSDSERNKNMSWVNPKFILRKHILDYVIYQAKEKNDYSKLETVLMLVQDPFMEHSNYNNYC